MNAAARGPGRGPAAVLPAPAAVLPAPAPLAARAAAVTIGLGITRPAA